MTGLIAWLVLGAIAGAIANALYRGRRVSGILPTIGLGIVGAFLGGSLNQLLTYGNFMLVGTSLSVPGIFLAVLGAILALWIRDRWF